MKKEPMQKLDLSKWLTEVDPMTQHRFMAAHETAIRLSNILPEKKFLDMIRKIIKNHGRSNGTFYGFDCVQNPSNYINIPI